MPEPEIGSEFPLVPGASRGGRALAGTTLGRPRSLLRSGRDALRALLEVCPPGPVGLPAYACESLHQACAEREVRVLPVDSSLHPRPEAVQRFDGAVLVFLPLWGGDAPEALRQEVARARGAGLVVLEDRTHCLLSPGVEPVSEVGFASLRKWAAMPDGGCCYGLSTGRTPIEPGTPFAERRRDAMSRKARWLQGATEPKEEWLRDLGAAEHLLDASPLPRAMSEAGRRALDQVDWALVARRRRQNERRLRAGLRGLPLTFAVRPDEEALPESVTPLGGVVFFPEPDLRDRVRRALIRERIYCPVHWPLPSAVSPDAHPDAWNAGARILTLPCDQRYDFEDMDRLVDAVRRATQ